MDKNKAIAHFEGLIRDTDRVLPHCSEALRAELLEQRGYYKLALEALRPAPSDEPLTREQLMQVRPERPILVRVRCLDEETGEPDPEDEEFEIWDGQCFANANTYDTLEHYGEKFLAYAYAPACVGVELTGTLRTLESAQGPKGEPGPFGAGTSMELADHLIAQLEHDIAEDVRIPAVDGDNHMVAVDAYAVRQVLEVLRQHRAAPEPTEALLRIAREPREFWEVRDGTVDQSETERRRELHEVQ